MTTQTTDQGLIIPDYPEQADGPLDFYQAYTGGLESRLVKRYLNASDRTTRNPTPQTNELSVRADAPGVYEYWTGSTWAQQGGYAAKKLIKGIRITNTGSPMYATSGATELDLSRYAITGITLDPTQYYTLSAYVTWTKSVATDDYAFRVRANTALTGQQVSITGNFATLTEANGAITYDFLFKGDGGHSLTITSLFLSVARGSGTGVISIFGAGVDGYRAWAALYQEGQPSLWTDVA